MTDPVQLAMIAAVVALVPSVLAYLTNIRVAKMQQAQKEHHVEAVQAITDVKKDIQIVTEKVKEVDGNVNGKMAQLLAVSEENAKAKGKLEAQAEAKDAAGGEALFNPLKEK